MCGRTYKTYTQEELAYRYLNLKPVAFPEIKPNYNMAPTQETWVLREINGEREFASMRWGLVPFSAKDIQSADRYSLINAKSEEISEKRSFKTAYQKRRCIIPMSGFFEWKKEGAEGKQPYCIHLKNDPIMSLAGIWEHWKSKEGNQETTSYAIITIAANEVMKTIHPRMPVILDRHDEEKWLHSEIEVDVKELLKPCPSEWMEYYPVTIAVNSPKNNRPEVLQPASH
ncbi:MAG: SOS response-associated peptidase [Nitrospirae bacterium]|nr:SOS response-associated peptidase [Nitrospirota bacterium]